MTLTRFAARNLLLFAATIAACSVQANSNQFCGGPAKGGDPADLANVVGDMTLEYAVQQPASMMTCSKGYWLEKCGDHETANLVFDKCIAAGYVGAMIWKALLLEDGSGVKPDLAEAARLMHRAATSDDPAYAPLGKLHYATMLHLGKGVPRDEAAARQWFESAAADGNEDAKAFLRTGYHTGERDQRGLGAGIPTAAALAPGLTGDNASITASQRKALSIFRESPAQGTPTPTPADTSPLPSALGQRLTAASTFQPPSLPRESYWLGLLLLLAIGVGALRQRFKLRDEQA